MDWLIDHLALIMFLALIVIMFLGYPVAFLLGAIGVGFGLLGTLAGTFGYGQFATLLPRIFGQAVQNPVLVAVPMFIFMGTMLERSGIAEDLLHVLQLALRRIPGGLAVAVTALGTIMAATTGIVGASVIMLTLIALPVMLRSGYDKALAVGTIASAGTLGILIPPSIMLVIMGDLVGIPVGTLFTGAILPGLLLSLLYVIFLLLACWLKPGLAPRLTGPLGAEDERLTVGMVVRVFIPPTVLMVLVLGSIFGGWATPTEAAGVGALGAILLSMANGRFNMKALREVMTASAMTNALVFFIIFGATLFAYVFRALGGDDLVVELLNGMGIETAWEVMIFVMALVFIMGFFFDWIEICLIVIPIFAPIVAKLDFGTFIEGKPLILAWFTILLAINMQTAFLTPPFGFALFYMKGVVPPSVTMADIYRGIIPFVTVQLAALGFCMIFPEIVLYLPRRFGFLD
jgi:tripartite ATP-independent transporter DctM subunit